MPIYEFAIEGQLIEVAVGTVHHHSNLETLNRLDWNDAARTIDATLEGGTVLQMGQEVHIFCRNNSGADIPNGTAVRINHLAPIIGNRPAIALSDSSLPPELYAIGMATQDIPNNTDGYVTAQGIVRDVDTSAHTEGDFLFTTSTPGVLSVSRPPAGELVQPIALVLRDHPTLGMYYVFRALFPFTRSVNTMVAQFGGLLTGMLTSQQAFEKIDGQFFEGAGSPEGVVTAVPGKLYTDTGGGAGTTLYVKESGTGNTGWVAK
jgi:hypothetical protein